MSTQETDERVEALVKNFNINQEEALNRVQRDEEEKQFRTKVLNKLKSVWDIGIAGLPQILTLLSSTTPLVLGATVSGFVVSVWSREQQNKLLDKLNKQLNERINETNAELNKPALNFDEFMELFVQAMDIASESKSEMKRQSLAKALVNSLIPPTSQFTGKQALLRILAQLSDEEMVVLKVLYDEVIDAQNQGNFPAVSVTQIAEKLGWKQDETSVTCLELAQLFLVSDASIGQWNSFGHEHEVWRLTPLATKLIQWVTEEVPPATATETNTSESENNSEEATWSQLTAEQFFSGYSEEDAIYDQL